MFVCSMFWNLVEVVLYLNLTWTFWNCVCLGVLVLVFCQSLYFSMGLCAVLFLLGPAVWSSLDGLPVQDL